ncbi:MAG: transcription termination/antitermination factor NusG [Elusimicrobia bacterium]|nr:transcription termination/antitermination factor NusG [Elusimicrobiota bacterium]
MNDENKAAFTWYVVNTYTGQEEKVKTHIIKSCEKFPKLRDKIGEILIPRKDVITLSKGKKKIVEKEFFPGYIIINMLVDAETYWLVKNVPGVTDFLGKENPVPLRESEVKRIFDMIRAKDEQDPRPAVSFEEGDRVRIMDGPFDNFMGIVEDADDTKQKVKVMVTIFGRTTPVELDYLQVERL